MICERIRIKTVRDKYFLDYGDAEQYQKRIEEVRREFTDLKKQ